MGIEINMGMAMFMIISYIMIITVALIFKNMKSFEYVVIEKFLVIGFFLIVISTCTYFFIKFAPPVIPWITVSVNVAGAVFLVGWFWKQLREEA